MTAVAAPGIMATVSAEHAASVAASAASLGLGAAWRLLYPASAWSLALFCLSAALVFAAQFNSALARRRALRDAMLVPGSLLHRVLTGRLPALAAAVVGTAATLFPAAFFLASAAPAECAAAALLVVTVNAAIPPLRRGIARSARTAFVPRLLALGTAGLALVAVPLFAWLGYAVVPPPRWLAADTLAQALAQALALHRTDPVGQILAGLDFAEVTIWWYMRGYGFGNGAVVAAFLAWNALIVLALARFATDIAEAGRLAGLGRTRGGLDDRD